MFYHSIDRNGKDKHEYDVSGTVAAAVAAIDHSRDGAASVGSSDLIQQVEDNAERTGEMCVGHSKPDIVIIFTRRLFTQLYARWHLYRLQHQELTHL